jgi:hypothetical protein
MTNKKKTSITAATAALLAVLMGLTNAAAARGPDAGTAPIARPVAAPAGNLDPGPYHRNLDPLVGTWKATKYNYILGGGGDPVVSHDITVTVKWISKTGGRFLQERTEGTLASNRYYRLGLLGFSTIDRRYEWTTFDSVTPTAMTYRGAPLTEVPSVLSIPGTFTDPGLLGPGFLGKTIGMRTVITLRPKAHPTLDLYFTPPGQLERLVDRVVYDHRID